MGRERPTEAVHEGTADLDRRSAGEILRAIHAEDRRAVEALGRVLPAVEDAVDVLVCALAGGGRWFNVGAGTSGRMGMLDAVELPPTFGLPPDRVVAVVAGGERALARSVEGAEDDGAAAAWALRERGLRAGDAVVALSAGGETPFALAAVESAHAVGARTIAITCAPHSSLAAACEIAIAPEVGPEVIAGSTRMKGGLVQKLVLHLLSTTVMVRLGHVDGNRMTHLVPASAKLRERAVGLVAELGGVDAAAAARLLEGSDGSVVRAVEKARSRDR